MSTKKKLLKEALEELLKGRAGMEERTRHELARLDIVLELVRDEISRPEVSPAEEFHHGDR